MNTLLFATSVSYSATDSQRCTRSSACLDNPRVTSDFATMLSESGHARSWILPDTGPQGQHDAPDWRLVVRLYA
jgi:hypothetical protein